MNTRPFWLLLASAHLAACGDGANALWGSFGESQPLDFERVDIVRQETDLRIEYLRGPEADRVWVCRLTIDTNSLPLRSNTEVSSAAFTKNVTLERTIDEDQTDFPPLSGGMLYVETYGEQSGDPVAGDFRIVFADGRTLAGAFDSELRVETALDGTSDPGPMIRGQSACAAGPSADFSALLVGAFALFRRRRPSA